MLKLKVIGRCTNCRAPIYALLELPLDEEGTVIDMRVSCQCLHRKMVEHCRSQKKAVALIMILGGQVWTNRNKKDSSIVAADLSDTKVADADLETLKPLTQLRRLYLQSTTITDPGLVHLRGLSELHTLSLNHTKVTDAGLENLKGLSKLKTLSLADTRVTNKGMEQLKGLAKLQTLHLEGSLVTDAGVKELTAALPKLEIDR